jgi:hypothetical protein
MATYTTIALLNKALVLCGAASINAITDDTPNARALNAIYDISRKSILTECKWTFSTTRSTLSTVATTTIAWFHIEEGYVYTRPSAALRIWEMSDCQAIWREEYGYIISNTANLGAKYCMDHSEVGVWPPKFVEAFIDKLCSDICFMILNSASKAESFLSKYQKVSLPQAKTENSQTGTQQQARDDEWLSSKFGGGNPARSYS